MGDVRVRARLTNAIDEGLARRGELPPHEVRAYEADAMVDIGAVRTVVPPEWWNAWGCSSAGSGWWSTRTDVRKR